MAYLPVMLNVRGKKVVVIGGGAVAVRRTRALLEAGAKVVVIAPDIDGELDATDAQLERRAYRTGDLKGAMAVVIATDNPEVNGQVAADAATLHVLVNRTDEAESGDFIVPAHRRQGPITMAVATDGISAAAARHIMDQIQAAVDPDWAMVLEVVAPYRTKVQQVVTDPHKRQQVLRRLTDGEAFAAYKSGGIQALGRHVQEVIADAQ